MINIKIKYFFTLFLLFNCLVVNASDAITKRYVLNPRLSCMGDHLAPISIVIRNEFSHDIKIKEEDLGFMGELNQGVFSVVLLDDIYSESISEHHQYRYFKGVRKNDFSEWLSLSPDDSFTYSVSLEDFYNLDMEFQYIVTIFNPKVRNEVKNEIKKFDIYSNSLLIGDGICREMDNKELSQLIEKQKNNNK